MQRYFRQGGFRADETRGKKDASTEGCPSTSSELWTFKPSFAVQTCGSSGTPYDREHNRDHGQLGARGTALFPSPPFSTLSSSPALPHNCYTRGYVSIRRSAQIP